MRKRRSGCIVTVTSVAGRVSSASHSPYTASKWALEALCESLAGEIKAFGVRVAIVEPGVIATPIFDKHKPPEKPSLYPHQRRMHALFTSSLKNPVSPYLVGETIRGIVDSDSWQLRYPVGPDAAPLLAMRSKITDEEWIAGAAVSDQEWKDRMKQSMGLDIEL
jgi:NAD(P)-dependent dehydrogenase (short-subunit alcohol dehydrogenase family)